MMKRMMMLMKRKSSKMMFGPRSLVSLDGFSSCDHDAYGDEHDAAYDVLLMLKKVKMVMIMMEEMMVRMMMKTMKMMSRKMMFGPPALVSLASV